MGFVVYQENVLTCVVHGTRLRNPLNPRKGLMVVLCAGATQNGKAVRRFKQEQQVSVLTLRAIYVATMDMVGTRQHSFRPAKVDDLRVQSGCLNANVCRPWMAMYQCIYWALAPINRF